MNVECGMVVKEEKGRILVESEPEGFCVSCKARGSCTMSQDTKKRQLWMDNVLGASPGDQVSFGIKEEGMVILSIVIYLIPVIFVIGGAVAGSAFIGFLSDTDLKAALGGLIGLLVSFVIIWLVSRLFSHKKSFTPQLLSIMK